MTIQIPLEVAFYVTRLSSSSGHRHNIEQSIVNWPHVVVDGLQLRNMGNAVTMQIHSMQLGSTIALPKE